LIRTEAKGGEREVAMLAYPRTEDEMCHAAEVRGEFVGKVVTGIEMIGTATMMEDRTDVDDSAIKVGLNLATNC